VVVNRGLRARMFRSVDEAVKWILASPGEGE
jgi:hypothetical protein